MNTVTGLYLGRIPYARVGSGSKPLIVLNGGQAFVRRPSAARSQRDATRVAKLLPANTDFVLVGYELTPAADFAMDRIIADLARIIAQEFGSVRLIGISYGGIVGLRLAAAHPHLVTDLVVLASAHDFSAEGHGRVQRQIAFAQRRDFAALLDDFAAVFRRRWLNGLLRLRLWLERRRLAEGMNEPDFIVRGLRAVLDAASPDPRWLARIQARTLIIGGARDQFFGDGRMAETAAHIANATLKIFADETHMLPVERRRDVAALLSAFLAR